MRSVLIRVAVLGALPLVASACGGRYPASPVAAPLTHAQAVEVAQAELGDRLEGATLRSIHPTGRGHLLGYVGRFDAGAEPSRPSTLVSVRHDGTVREYAFKRD